MDSCSNSRQRSPDATKIFLTQLTDRVCIISYYVTHPSECAAVSLPNWMPSSKRLLSYPPHGPLKLLILAKKFFFHFSIIIFSKFCYHGLLFQSILLTIVNIILNTKIRLSFETYESSYHK